MIFTLKCGYATLKKQLIKKLQSFNQSASVGVYNPNHTYDNGSNRFLAFSLLMIVFLFIPEGASAQETIEGTGDFFTKFKNFINNQIIPGARILANVAIILSFMASIGLAVVRDPRWKWAVGTTLLVAILWYAGPSILNEIREGFEGTYQIN